MMLEELKYADIQKLHGTVLTEIYTNKRIGVVIRDFFDSSMVLELIEMFNSYPFQKFEPAVGYKALPRPFGGILGAINETLGYQREIDYVEGRERNATFKETFKRRLEPLCGNANIVLADVNQDVSLSKSWFSIRELEANNGSFDLHCGNYFIDWNRPFFNYQDIKLLPNNHLAFLSMINQPQSIVDLIIYNVHWKDACERVDLQTLRTRENNLLHIESIPSFRISLNAGDLLVFNESNYWHQVPRFTGTSNRMTIGGFISQKRDSSDLVVWA